MEHRIYKLLFKTPVHFGTGILNESDIGFCADTLFSALYIEALKMGCETDFFEAVKKGNLLFSDAFPYVGTHYFLPKPMVYIDHSEEDDLTARKKYKKIKYVPAEEFENFLSGRLDPTYLCDLRFGKEYDQVMTAVRGDDDPRPYCVGNFLFNENCGLYVIVKINSDDEKYMLDDLFDSLSYTGIGGKRSSGKGKFELKHGIMDDHIHAMLEKPASKYMLISSSLPKEDELEMAIDGASYLLKKRSGFVYSEKYAKEQKKKKDLYTMQSGSCFVRPFSGDIYDVGENGSHPVYRYAKALFLGI